MDSRVMRFALLAIGITSGCIQLSAHGAKPNVVLIMADDMGYECISANGSEDYKTPNIDKLAAEGVRFEQCFSNAICTPSRVKIMTGLYNKRNFTKFAHMDRGQVTFAHLLKKAGYATAVAGKWQLGGQADSAQHFGFDQSCLWRHNAGGSRYPNPGLSINGKPVKYNNGEYGPDVCTDFICDFIEANKDKPFLAYYPMILPHCPFEPTPDSDDWDPKSPGSATYKGPGDDAMKKKNFTDMVQYIDKLVGRIVRKLEALGIRDNTMIIFTGDNGTDTPIVTRWKGRNIAGAKGKPYDAGVRVPLVINWPGKIAPRVLKNELVEFSDFLPTLCEVSGAPLPEDYPGDGVSLWPVLSGTGGSGGTGGRVKEHVYIWYFRGWMMVRNQHFGVRRGHASQQAEYSKYSGHYSREKVEIDSATEREQAAIGKMKKVMDDMATVDSIFMGATAHKGRRASTPAKETKESSAPAAVKTAVSAAPFSLKPAGTRYEAEAGELSGGATLRKSSSASGGSLIAGMQAKEAACTLTVDGAAAGGSFDLILGYAALKKMTCVLDLQGVKQSVQLPGTGGWNTLGVIKLAVKLNPGKNKIEITSQGGMKLDYLELKRLEK